MLLYKGRFTCSVATTYDGNMLAYPKYVHNHLDAVEPGKCVARMTNNHGNEKCRPKKANDVDETRLSPSYIVMGLMYDASVSKFYSSLKISTPPSLRSFAANF